MPPKAPSILGRYRITEMPDFDAEYVDEETKAFIRFDAGGRGEFHFGFVHGIIDHRVCQRDGKPATEWSWDGNDEHHPAMGRGWAVLEDDGTLSGVIFFYQSDDHAFRAKKWAGGVVRKGPPKTRKTKVIDFPTGKLVQVDVASLKDGPIRNPSLPDSLLKRIRVIHTHIKSGYAMNLEQFEIGFMRDAHPEREIAIWERIAEAFEKTMTAMPKLDGQMVLGKLAVLSMGGLSADERADPVVKKIIEIAKSVWRSK